MKIDLNNALNIMYAKEKRILSTVEPGTDEYEYRQGRLNAYEEAIELFYISEGMPIDALESLTDDDLELIEKEQGEINVAIGEIAKRDTNV